MKDFIPIPSLNNQFGINEDAQIKNFKTGKIISPYVGVDLYQHVTLYLNGSKIRKRVHRLMAEVFLDNCEVIDHFDGNKSNNKVSNLRAVSHSENIRKAYQENTYINPHKGRGIWIIAENKETKEQIHFKSMRECERATGIDRHRIKHFLLKERTNNTPYNFYYDE